MVADKGHKKKKKYLEYFLRLLLNSHSPQPVTTGIIGTGILPTLTRLVGPKPNVYCLQIPMSRLLSATVLFMMWPTHSWNHPSQERSHQNSEERRTCQQNSTGKCEEMLAHSTFSLCIWWTWGITTEECSQNKQCLNVCATSEQSGFHAQEIKVKNGLKCNNNIKWLPVR